MKAKRSTRSAVALHVRPAWVLKHPRLSGSRVTPKCYQSVIAIFTPKHLLVEDLGTSVVKRIDDFVWESHRHGPLMNLYLVVFEAHIHMVFWKSFANHCSDTEPIKSSGTISLARLGDLRQCHCMSILKTISGKSMGELGDGAGGKSLASNHETRVRARAHDSAITKHTREERGMKWQAAPQSSKVQRVLLAYDLPLDECEVGLATYVIMVQSQ